MKDFKDLVVWQKSIALTRSVYALTKKFPDYEQFGLVSQMTRAAVSIPSNVAEGSMRKSARYFAHFLKMALGSLGELETQIEVAYVEKCFGTVEYKEVIK